MEYISPFQKPKPIKIVEQITYLLGISRFSTSKHGFAQMKQTFLMEILSCVPSALLNLVMFAIILQPVTSVTLVTIETKLLGNASSVTMIIACLVRHKNRL